MASFGCIGLILDLLVPAVHAKVTHQSLSNKDALCLQLIDTPIDPHDTPYQAYMKVLDFVGGMTDNRAATLARDLSGMGMMSV